MRAGRVEGLDGARRVWFSGLWAPWKWARARNVRRGHSVLASAM